MDKRNFIVFIPVSRNSVVWSEKWIHIFRQMIYRFRLYFENTFFNSKEKTILNKKYPSMYTRMHWNGLHSFVALTTRSSVYE